MVQAHAIVTKHARLGARNLVGYGAVIGGAPQDFSFAEATDSNVLIGDDNTFRENVTIHRGTKEGSSTRIGNHNYLMAGVHVGHNATVGDRNVMANNCLLAGHVATGDDVVLGGAAVFHQFMRIGSMSMIRGGTAWGKDIPPYTVGVTVNTLCGLNVVGMRRRGINSARRAELKKAYNLVFRSGLNISQAMERGADTAWENESADFMSFIALKSKRGLCRASGEQVSQDEP